MRFDLPKKEEEVLKFWKEKNIFEKSLTKTRNGPRFVFYEGPPYANGLPGIHHLLARAFKDLILRYKTMQGFFVERKAGWDTHGLPTEVEAEKKLGIRTKKEIEKIGIEKFIRECKKNIFTYKAEWEEFTERIGFWLNLENAYITYSNDYIESLWWILKKIWEKGLLYKDFKVVPYCPRCGTSLSSHEVAQGYQTIKENSIYLKFPLKGEKNTYFLVWTTTPWTLPANVAIAAHPSFSYVKVKINSEYFILGKESLGKLKKEYETLQEVSGKTLLGREYEPLFPIETSGKKDSVVVPSDFISSKEGTGLVHIAPAFGEEDMETIKKQNAKCKTQNEPEFPILLTVDEEGKFKPEVKDWAGMFVKDADPLIIGNLQKRNLLFQEEPYEHEYPFCWRCDSPLIYFAKESWFIKMTALKEDLLKNNGKINWIPAYLKEGRFGEWLREIKDWNLSRERYWGTPLPIWQCQIGKNQKDCQNVKVIGSFEELEKLGGKKIKDSHRPYIDEVVLLCEKCGGEMRRVPEVIDVWFDSGAMPFAQWHYPFDNREKIDRKGFFPADFICEGVDQTRGWFYTLLAVSTALGLQAPYKNVISHGLVLDAKGQKMSKSKGNVVWPKDVIEQYGADTARFYFYTVNAVGDAKKFNVRDIQALSRKFFDTLENSHHFLFTYCEKGFQENKSFQSDNILDRWILSRLESLKANVIENLEKFEVIKAARYFFGFVDDLSNWYIRRSRKRFQNPESGKDKEEASQTLYIVLLEFLKLLAPFCPFLSERLYLSLTKSSDAESVHLTEYPKLGKHKRDADLEEKMELIRKIITDALFERAKSKIKVRQPLALLKIKSLKIKTEKELQNLIKKEVNVKEIVFDKELKNEVELDKRITPELKEEGMVRDFVRYLQEMRKEAHLTQKEEILIFFTASPYWNQIVEKNKNFILQKTKARDLKLGEKSSEVFEKEKQIRVDEEKLWIKIKRL